MPLPQTRSSIRPRNPQHEPPPPPRGSRVIAKRLNELIKTDPEMRSPTDDEWNVSTVFNLARRPVYFGLGIRLMAKAGVYVNGSKTGRAIPSKVTIRELAKKKRPGRTPRPREEWLEQD